MRTGVYFISADDLATQWSDWIAGSRTHSTFSSTQTTAWKTHLLPEGEQAPLNISRDISFREQFLKVRELRIQLTLRPWPIAGPRR
jgi:hypothetical protein